MGSLMAGWDSPVPDPKSVTLKRNWSLTKEEIESYWKSKKKLEEEHLRAIASPSESREENSVEKIFQRSSSMPLANTKVGFSNMEDIDTSLETFKKNGCQSISACRWTRSNWAFLNEPPSSEGTSNSYVSQFHVANRAAASELNRHDGLVHDPI